MTVLARAEHISFHCSCALDGDIGIPDIGVFVVFCSCHTTARAEHTTIVELKVCEVAEYGVGVSTRMRTHISQIIVHAEVLEAYGSTADNHF